jgi:hypothetical protein
VQLGLINTTGTSNKALVAQQKYKSKNPNKQHPHHNNKQNKGPKPSLVASTPNGDKGEKSKNKKTDRHYNFCGKDGHESKCFKKMEALETTMKKHNINIGSSSSNSYSHGHALSASIFSFNATSTSFDEWFIDPGASYHMAKDKAIFSTLDECNTKKIFVGDSRSLSVVRFGTV